MEKNYYVLYNQLFQLLGSSNSSAIDNARWLFCAVPLRYATRHGAKELGVLPARGFYRAYGAYQ